RNLCYRLKFSGHGKTDGMMREFMAWPTTALHPLPDRLSDVDGAMLEPLGVAIHSVDLGHLPFGGSASVIGCGPIGLLLIGVLRAAGASSVVAIEAAGNNEGVELAMASVRPGGRVVLAGIPGDDVIRFGASLARRKGLTI